MWLSQLLPDSQKMSSTVMRIRLLQAPPEYSEAEKRCGRTRKGRKSDWHGSYSHSAKKHVKKELLDGHAGSPPARETESDVSFKATEVPVEE